MFRWRVNLSSLLLKNMTAPQNFQKIGISSKAFTTDIPVSNLLNRGASLSFITAKCQWLTLQNTTIISWDFIRLLIELKVHKKSSYFHLQREIISLTTNNFCMKHIFDEAKNFSTHLNNLMLPHSICKICHSRWIQKSVNKLTYKN